MPTLKSEFTELASELIGDEFADFATERTFTKHATGGTYNPVTETQTGGTPEQAQSIPAIREEYTERQFDGQQIKTGDFKLLAEVAEFTSFQPDTEGVTVAVDGIDCQVVRASKDPADAVYTLQVRRL